MKTKPFAKIDFDKVDEMCKIQCTGEEIAGVLNIDYDTLNAGCKREKSMGFSDYFAQKRMGGKPSLRRAQWKAATEDGNSTMMVWLGKNVLGQVDKQEIDHNVNTIKGIKLISD